MECTAGSHASPPPNRARFPATPFSLPEFTRLFLQGHTSCGGLSKSCSSVVHPQYQARPLIQSHGAGTGRPFLPPWHFHPDELLVPPSSPLRAPFARLGLPQSDQAWMMTVKELATSECGSQLAPNTLALQLHRGIGQVDGGAEDGQ